MQPVAKIALAIFVAAGSAQEITSHDGALNIETREGARNFHYVDVCGMGWDPCMSRQPGMSLV